MTLCCDAESDGEGGATGEPTECALVVWAFIQGADKAALRKTWPRLAEVPFDSLRKMMSTVCRVPAEAGLPHPYLQFTKGAPDEVLRRCTRILRDGKMEPLDEADRKEIADKMFNSENTIKSYIRSILNKTGFDSVSKLAIYAVSHGCHSTHWS